MELKRNGSLAKFIQNPFFTRNFISYFGTYVGAPMLDSAGRIYVFTDNRQRGDALQIAAFSLFAEKPLWRTGYSYVGDPAVAVRRAFFEHDRGPGGHLDWSPGRLDRRRRKQ